MTFGLLIFSVKNANKFRMEIVVGIAKLLWWQGMGGTLISLWKIGDIL